MGEGGRAGANRVIQLMLYSLNDLVIQGTLMVVVSTKSRFCFQKDGLSSRSGEAEHEWQCRPVTSTIVITIMVLYFLRGRGKITIVFYYFHPPAFIIFPLINGW